jgi:hypothetical protein
MIFKFVYKRAGNHTHFRVWSGSTVGGLGLAGKLIMTNEEWDEFYEVLMLGALKNASSDVIFEEQVTSSPATRGNNDCHQD